MEYGVEPGPVDVLVGSSSEDIRLQGAFVIVGGKARLTQKVFFSS
jgi:beta-glucosidase